MNLAGVDLNLLVALDALLAERSVTRAANRVGLRFPSAATTYFARTGRRAPLARSRMTAVTPSASCSSATHSVP